MRSGFLWRGMLYAVVGACFYLAALGGWQRWKHTHPAFTLSQKISFQPGVNFMRYFVAPVSVSIPLGEDAEQASPACRKQWQDLLAMDLNPYGGFQESTELEFLLTQPDRLLTRLQTVASTGCQLPTETRFARVGQAMHAFQMACSDLPHKVELLRQRCGLSANPWASYSDMESPYDVCLQNMLRYRFASAEVLYHQAPVAEISDVPLLVDLFFAEGLHEQRSDQRLVEILTRVSEIDPGNYYAAKYLVQVAYAHWRTSANPASDEEAKLLFQEAAAQAESLKHSDVELVTMRLREAVLLKDPSLVKKRAETAIQQGFDNIGRYYLAWAHYLAGDKSRTQELLPQVLLSSTDDNNVYAVVAWNRLLEEGEPGKNAPVFLEPGSALAVSFLVPDHDSFLASGYVGFELLPDHRSGGPNGDPEIKQAEDQASRFQLAKGQCRKEAQGTGPDQIAAQWKECLTRSLAAMQASE